MQFSVMQTRTRRHLGQTSATNSYYTVQEVKDALNDANEIVAGELRVLLTYHTVTTTAATGAYTLADETLELMHVELDITGTNERRTIDIVSFDEFANHTYSNTALAGRPTMCKVEWGATATSGDSLAPGDIHLWPVPDDNGGSNYVLRIYTIQRPTTLTADADESELPLSTHLAVTYYAAMLLAMKDDDASRYQKLAPLYQREIDRQMKIRNQRERRKRPAIVSAHRAMGPGPKY